MSETQAAEFITKELQEYAWTSTENRLPYDKNHLFFDEPLVRSADGDDRL